MGFCWFNAKTFTLFYRKLACFVNYVHSKGGVIFLKHTMSAFPSLKSHSLSLPGYLVQLLIHLTSSAFNECQRSNESVLQPVPHLTVLVISFFLIKMSKNPGAGVI